MQILQTEGHHVYVFFLVISLRAGAGLICIRMSTAHAGISYRYSHRFSGSYRFEPTGLCFN